MKNLRVGDPHVKPSNIEESERLMQFVFDTATALGVDTIELLGDLFHTHSIVRLEVLEFWQRWLWKLSESFVTIVLVGNHDLSGNHHSDSHALSVFVALNPGKLWIIEHPALIQGIGYLPYIHDNSKFISEANTLAELGAKFLVSHTTYAGSKYDNGMYAPDGVDPTLIDERLTVLLSGHVHTEQEYGRVDYPGTARWDTASDANKRKGIWLYEHSDSGTLVKKEFISTESVCVPLISIEWKEGDPQVVIKDGSRVTVELIGTSKWINKAKESLKGKASVRTRITDSKINIPRNASGSLIGFIQATYQSKFSKERLLAFMKEIGLE